MRRGLTLAVALLGACTPTLSAPTSAAHVEAMRDASRHHHHGRFEEAITSWQEASSEADRRVDRDEADYRIARTLRRLGRHDEAIALLDDIASREPLSRRQIRARFDAAILRLELERDVARAHESLEWIVRNRPGDGPASRALRILLDAREDDVAFLRELFEAIGESDLGDDVLMELAERLHEAGDRAEAIRTLEQLVEAFPYPHGQRWDDALWRLADFTEEAGDFEGALAYLREMVDPHSLTITPGSQTLPRMPRARLRMARICRDRLDDPARAAGHFQATYDEFPHSRLRDDARYELGAMWLDRGEREQGCETLRSVVDEFEVGHARRLAARRVEDEC